MIFIIVCYFGVFIDGILWSKIKILINRNLLGLEYERKKGKTTITANIIHFIRLEKDQNGKVYVLW